MLNDSDDRTLDATPRRRQDALEQGQMPSSRHLVSAGLLLAGLLALGHFGGQLMDRLGEVTVRCLGTTASLQASQELIVQQCHVLMSGFAGILIPLMCVLVVAAVVINAAQTGWQLRFQRVLPDLGQVSPSTGFNRLFTAQNYVQTGWTMIYIAVILGVASWSLWAQRVAILSLSALEARQIGSSIVHILFWTCMKIAVTLLAIAVVDYARLRWRFERDLRMTAQEAREEVRSLQGDPSIRSRRRSQQRRIALDRLDNAVRVASAIIADEDEDYAIAVRYDPLGTSAPIVVAKGASYLAQRIRQLAQQHQIPCYPQPRLAQSLFRSVEVHQSVSVRHFAALAELLRNTGSHDKPTSAAA